MFYSLSFKRASALTLITGLLTFSAAMAALALLGHGGVVEFLTAHSGTVLDIAIATVFALCATVALGIVLTAHQTRALTQYRTAVDSMPQGLCMFDASERLVICNSHYYEMYNLASDDARPGATLSEVLLKRVAKGTFSRDPQDYRKQFLASVREGRTITHEVKQSSGRILLVTNHPMQDGGWIGVHEDITQRREVEDKRQVVRQLTGGHLEPRHPVGGRERQHRHAALARVTVAVVGEVQRASPAQVESLHVVPGHGLRRGEAQPLYESPERLLASLGRTTRCLVELTKPGEQRGGWILQQH